MLGFVPYSVIVNIIVSNSAVVMAILQTAASMAIKIKTVHRHLPLNNWRRDLPAEAEGVIL